MEQLKHYVLPENVNRLYTEEASSAIGLCRDLAAKYNELVDAFNSFNQTDLAWKQGQEGTIRKGILYMKDNLVNTIHDILNTVDLYKLVNEDTRETIMQVYDDLSAQVKAFGNGSPIAVDSVADMSNTSKIYLLTIDGKWYYHNGTTWTPGGTYQSMVIADGSVTSAKRSVVGEYGYLFSEKGIITIDIDSRTITLSADHVLIYRNKNITVTAKTFSIPSANPYMLYFDIENRDFRWHRPSDATYQATENCVYLGYISIADGGYTQLHAPRYNVVRGGKSLSYTNGSMQKPSRVADLLSGNVAIDTANKTVTFTNAVYSLGYRYVTVTNTISYTEESAARIKYVVYDETTTAVKVYENRNSENMNEILLFAFYAGKLYHSYVNRHLYTINGKAIGEATNPLNGLSASFIGDSLTRGAGSSKPFTETLAELSSMTIHNFGVDGSCVADKASETAASFIDRKTDYNTGVDIIGIMGGTNDYWNNVPLGTIGSTDTTTFYGALEYLVSTFITYKPGVFLFLMTPPQAYRSESRLDEGYAAFPYPKNNLGLSLDDYCEAIRKVCAKYSLPCLDLQKNSGMTPLIFTQDALYYHDGVHFNAEGYSKIGNIVYKFLLNNYN